MGQDGWRVAGYEVTSELLCYDQLHHTWASHGSCLSAFYYLYYIDQSCLSAFYYFFYIDHACSTTTSTWIWSECLLLLLLHGSWLLFVPFIRQLGLSFASEKWSDHIHRYIFIIWASRWYCVKWSATEAQPLWWSAHIQSLQYGRYDQHLQLLKVVSVQYCNLLVFLLPQMDHYGIPWPIQNC